MTQYFWTCQVLTPKRLLPLKENLPLRTLLLMEKRLVIESKNNSPKLLQASYCIWWSGKDKALECLPLFFPKSDNRIPNQHRFRKIFQINFLKAKPLKDKLNNFLISEIQDCSKKLSKKKLKMKSIKGQMLYYLFLMFNQLDCFFYV